MPASVILVIVQATGRGGTVRVWSLVGNHTWVPLIVVPPPNLDTVPRLHVLVGARGGIGGISATGGIGGVTGGSSGIGGIDGGTDGSSGIGGIVGVVVRGGGWFSDGSVLPSTLCSNIM